MKSRHYLTSALLAALLVVPFITDQQYIINIMVMSSIMAILAVSWNLLSGYTGLFSFGHPAFFGIGAYTSALIALHAGWSPWWCMFIGGFFAAAFSLIVALPTLRLQGPYVAVVTLAFMMILGKICYNWTALTNGPMGLSGIPAFPAFNLFGYEVYFEGISRIPYYYVSIAILLITMGVTYLVIHSPLGLHLMAIRESEHAAAAMGVRVVLNKIIIFLISSFFAGVAGALYAHYILLLTPEVFAFILMASILASTLIGGWGTFYGPAVGAFILTFLTDVLKDLGDIHQLCYGAFLVLVIFIMPKGLIVEFQKLVTKGVLKMKGERR